MVKARHFLFIFTLILVSSIESIAQNNGDNFLHTIQKGENLYTIASMYNVSKEEIIKLNPGSDKVIYSGKTLIIPQKNIAKDNDIFYTIKSGDTLYRLSVNYKVSINAIIDANPGLSAQNFKIGQVIRIPQATTEDFNKEVEKRQEEKAVIQPEVKSRCREMHKVKRKETIYSVSRKYNVTEEALIAVNPELKKGMKKGMYICIPNEEVVETQKIIENPYIIENPPTDKEVFKEKEIATKKDLSTISAAIILPFLGENSKKGESYRMLEFYEGFLMAVDSLKQKGVSMDIHVYDSGYTKSSINKILANQELKRMDVIFGPLYQDQIEPLAKFSEEYNIRLVLPFTAKTEIVFSNPYIYQINTPQSYLYNEVYQNFAKKFANPNIIFVESSYSDKSKSEFIEGFKLNLNSRGIKYNTLKAAIYSDEEIEQVAKLLDYNKKNIFIPTSGKEIALNDMLPVLNQLKELYPEIDTSVFGYPEWQTYTKDYIDVFFNLDTYFYSSFYTNNLLPGAKSFIKSYQKWYSKSMIDTYPKYGMLGFDVAYFFLTGLSTYGNGLEDNIDQVHIPNSIQTGFSFSRVNTWAGFVNKKVFFVHFNRNYELTKIEFE